MLLRTEELLFSFDKCVSVSEKKVIVAMLHDQLLLCHGEGKKATIPETKEIFSGCDENHLFKKFFDIKIINFIINEILEQGYSTKITSGYRCGLYNAVNYLINNEEVSKNSLHIQGQAVDLQIYKNNKRLSFDEYQKLVKAWQEKEIYNFKYDDWQKILEENKFLNLTKDFLSLFYYKVYNEGEGIDLDNIDGCPYIHIDTRGIKNTIASMAYYFNAGLTSTKYLLKITNF